MDFLSVSLLSLGCFIFGFFIGWGLCKKAARGETQSFMLSPSLDHNTTSSPHPFPLSGISNQTTSIPPQSSPFMQPVEQSLSTLHSKLAEMERSKLMVDSQLAEQIRGLNGLYDRLHQQTDQLVRALRTPDIRGRWGELQLRRVVELAGMTAHCDFDEQVHISEQDFRRPDLIVHLPGGKDVIIDSKAPLLAYMEAMEAADDDTRQSKLATHVRYIRRHIQDLGDKKYWHEFTQSPEFVVLFLPGECFFSAAVMSDPDLISFAAANQVVLASPTTLIALLRAIHYGWQQEQSTRNAQEIVALARELCKNLEKTAAYWKQLGKYLNKSVAEFNLATQFLETQLWSSMRKFQGWGVVSTNHQMTFSDEIFQQANARETANGEDEIEQSS